MNVLINTPSFIILSACQGKDIEVDTINTSKLKDCLKYHGVVFKEVLGCYGSKKEVSFYVQSDNIKTYLGLAGEFNQECILYVNEHRQACLLSKHGALRNAQDIGYFTQVKQEVALQSANFTYDHENDGYYICK